MSAREFKSFARTPAPKPWSEADIVGIARQLLTEHVRRREEATKAANLVCGNCEGSGQTASTLMPGEKVKCFACEGTGQPNDKFQNCPALTAEDNERMWKIEQLLKGPHRVAVLRVVKEYFPGLYRESDGAPN